MKKQFKRFVYLVLSLMFLVTSILSVPRLVSAANPTPVKLSSLASGNTVHFGGQTWIVLDPGTGYLLMQGFYGSNKVFDSDDTQIFNPKDQNNIAYYLNNDFYNSLPPADAALIQSYSWTLEDNSGGSHGNVDCKVGLISYSEFNAFRDSVINYSGDWWLRTPFKTPTNYVNMVNGIYILGRLANQAAAARPALYLNSNILVSGGNGGTVLEQTPMPTITTPVMAGADSVSGTAVADASVKLSVNGTAQTPVAADGSGNWTVSGLTTLNVGDAISVTATAIGNNESNPATAIAANPPGVPTIGTATAGNGQATVSFTAPTTDGGSPITGYTVTSSPGGLTAHGASSPITVSGLTNGTAYTFTVTATNAAGTGAASSATTSVTPTAPITNFANTTKTSSTATFAWTAANGATNLIIQQSPFGANIWTKATTTSAIAVDATTATVTGLNQATGYDFRLLVTGGVNAGNSNIVSVTTDAVPKVTSLSETSGPSAGGTTVTINGTGFTGATAVKFGSTIASSITVNSDTSITATSPAGSGTVDVTVTTPGGTSAASLADQFTYIPASSITSISPTSGPSAGGTTVTINGTGFTGATAVKFGSTIASSITVNSDTSITATSPAGSGTVDVTVTTPGGTSNTSNSDKFTFTVQLTTPSGLSWDSTIHEKAEWSAVSNASGYSVQLKKGGNNQGSAILVSGGTDYYDFTSAIIAAGSGSYAFTVTAVGDGTNYSNSAESGESSAYNYNAPAPPPPPPPPVWTWYPGELQFSQSSYSVDENLGTATITVNRLYGSDGTVTVHYITSDNTATAGDDYTATSGDLTFGYGETSKTFTIPIVNDNILENDETVNLTLSNPTGGAYLGSQNTAMLTIKDTTLPDENQYLLFPVSGNANGVSKDKHWQIKFNQELDQNSVDQATLFICNAKTGERQPVSYEFTNDSTSKATTLTITPTQPYISGQNYILYITTGVKTVDGSVLKKGLRVPFIVQ